MIEPRIRFRQQTSGVFTDILFNNTSKKLEVTQDSTLMKADKEYILSSTLSYIQDHVKVEIDLTGVSNAEQSITLPTNAKLKLIQKRIIEPIVGSTSYKINYKTDQRTTTLLNDVSKNFKFLIDILRVQSDTGDKLEILNNQVGNFTSGKVELTLTYETFIT